VNERLVYLLYFCATRLIGLLPITLAFRLGSFLGFFAWLLAVPYRRLVLENLRIAFAREKTERELRALTRQHFQTLGANLLSSTKAAFMSPEDIAKHVEWKNIERFRTPLEQGRGVVCLVHHSGNWELMSLIDQWMPGFNFSFIYQPLGNALIDADVRRTRGRKAMQTFSRHDGFTGPAKILRTGGAVGILPDQHAGDYGVWAPFFGRLASTSPLPAILAQRSNAILLPMASRTVGVARWEMHVHEPLDTTGLSVEETTAQVNLAAERLIRESPADWFWVHNRWKTPHPHFLLQTYKRGVALPAGMKAEELQPFNLLIRSSNWLGDAVMTIPAIRAIKAGRPDLRITILCREKIADVWKRAPEVSEVIALGNKEGVFSAAKKIRGRFDAALLLPNSPRTALEVWLAGVPRRVGYAGNKRDWFLNHAIERQPHIGPPRHQAHDYLDLAKAIGAVFDREAILRSFSNAPDRPIPEMPRIGVCPGAEYGPAKRWPIERFAEVMRNVNIQRPSEWVLFGTKADEEAGHKLKNVVTGGCTNLIGRTTLAELIEQLEKCDLLLTNDTGTMHLAAWLGVPVAAIFGSTEHRLTGPLGDGHLILRRHAECSPCFLRECPIDFRCMTAVKGSWVVEKILTRLGGLTQ